MEISVAELQTSRDFLKQCETTCAAVRGVFLVAGYVEGATRLNDIGGRLGDLIAAVDKLISKGGA
jgi:hypothetical protein